jgi:hypothetical protein
MTLDAQNFGFTASAPVVLGHTLARVVAPRSRVVVLRAPADTPEALEASGLSVLAAEAETVVAARG